jgi:hypothetical protein
MDDRALWQGASHEPHAPSALEEVVACVRAQQSGRATLYFEATPLIRSTLRFTPAVDGTHGPRPRVAAPRAAGALVRVRTQESSP